jgi:hypothetical protein
MNIDVINKRLKIISDLNEELNRIKSLHDESLDNNPEFQEVQEQEQKVKSETKEKKEKVLANPTIKAMGDQMKDLRVELKENKEALAQELVEYYRESGLMEITDPEGNTKKIKFSAKLTNE